MNSGSSKGRLLAVGDIHGCLSSLQKLLQLVDPQDNDHFVFLGDYIDRGEDSVGVVDYLIAFSTRYSSTFLRGNHEQMLMDWFDEKESPWLQYNNGGAKTLQDYNDSQSRGIPNSHLEFFRKTPLSWVCDNYIFVHAGLRPCIPLEKQAEDDLLWIREPFLSSKYDWGKTVVFGHTVLEKPLITHNRIGLDTGAGHGGRLTCCDVLSGQSWSIQVDLPN